MTRVTAYEMSVRVKSSSHEVTDPVNMQVERSRSASRGSHAAYHVFPLPFRKGKHERGKRNRSARGREAARRRRLSLFSSREVTDRLNMQVKPSCSASRSFTAAYHVSPSLRRNVNRGKGCRGGWGRSWLQAPDRCGALDRPTA